MRTPRLPAVNWTDVPTNLNGLVRLGERRNVVSVRVPSRSARALQLMFAEYFVKVKQSLYRLWGFQEVQAPRFPDSQYIKVLRLSALRTGRPYTPPQGNNPGTHICFKGWAGSKAIARPEGFCQWKFPMTIGNRNRELPACSAVPQPTAPPRALFNILNFTQFKNKIKKKRHKMI